jgi:hypothetical protein
MARSTGRRGATVLAAAFLVSLAVVSTGATSARPAAVVAEPSRAQAATRLTLCGIFLSDPSNGCKLSGATGPFDARHRLVARAIPRLARGDSIRIVGNQTDPVRRFLGVIRECFASPCVASVAAPRRGGIVAANYVAYLVRGGVPTPRIRSNAVRYAWLTKPRLRWEGVWSATRWGGRVTCTETATTVNCTYDWGGGGTYTATKAGNNMITGTWRPATPPAAGGNPGGPFTARLLGTTFEFTDRSQGQNLTWTATCISGACLING